MFLEIELINIKKHEQILYQLGYQYDHASWTEDIEDYRPTDRERAVQSFGKWISVELGQATAAEFVSISAVKRKSQFECSSQ